MKFFIAFIVALTVLHCHGQDNNRAHTSDIYITKAADTSSDKRKIECYGVTCDSNTVHCRAKVDRGPDDKTWKTNVECRDENGSVLNTGVSTVPAPFVFSTLQGYSNGGYGGTFAGNGGSGVFIGSGSSGSFSGSGPSGSFSGSGPSGTFAGNGGSGIFVGSGPPGSFGGNGGSGSFSGCGPSGCFSGNGPSGTFAGNGGSGSFSGTGGSGTSAGSDGSGSYIGTVGNGGDGITIGGCTPDGKSCSVSTSSGTRRSSGSSSHSK